MEIWESMSSCFMSSCPLSSTQTHCSHIKLKQKTNKYNYVKKKLLTAACHTHCSRAKSGSSSGGLRSDHVIHGSVIKKYLSLPHNQSVCHFTQCYSVWSFVLQKIINKNLCFLQIITSFARNSDYCNYYPAVSYWQAESLLNLLVK